MVRAEFSLVDHNGKPTTDADFRGRFMLVYFGFTNCRVVCPRSLTKLSAALERLGASAHRIAPLYISVDPERDTPAVMKAYLENKYPRFTGLTGTASQLSAAQSNYRVFAQRKPGAGDDYEVPHTAIAYVIGPDGEYRAHFLEHLDDREVAAQLEAILHDAAASNDAPEQR